MTPYDKGKSESAKRMYFRLTKSRSNCRAIQWGGYIAGIYYDLIHAVP